VIPAARPEIGQEELDAVSRVLKSGMLAQGPEVEAFETEFSAVAAGGREAIAVNSGTSALHIMLLALGVGPGDEVLVPSFTFAATANSVALTGATPVFVDIDPDTFCMSPQAAEAAITERTVGIMPVHLYGHPADLVALGQICRTRGLLLLEDAAQAHLAAIDDRQVGTWGDASAFSFYPTKNMTSAEGGMIIVSDPDVARRARLLRNQGQERRYENEVVGFNCRMTDVHAAIGRVQLEALPGRTVKRRSHAATLTSELHGLQTPVERPGCFHVYHQYTVRIPDGSRDEFAAQLSARGVGSGVYYPIPNHRLPSFDVNRDLPETEKAAAEVLSLPVYPSLTEAELETVIAAVNEIAKAGA